MHGTNAWNFSLLPPATENMLLNSVFQLGVLSRVRALEVHSVTQSIKSNTEVRVCVWTHSLGFVMLSTSMCFPVCQCKTVCVCLWSWHSWTLWLPAGSGTGVSERQDGWDVCLRVLSLSLIKHESKYLLLYLYLESYPSL